VTPENSYTLGSPWAVCAKIGVRGRAPPEVARERRHARARRGLLRVWSSGRARRMTTRPARTAARYLRDKTRPIKSRRCPDPILLAVRPTATYALASRVVSPTPAPSPTPLMTSNMASRRGVATHHRPRFDCKLAHTKRATTASLLGGLGPGLYDSR